MNIEEFKDKIVGCFIREEFHQTEGRTVVYSGSHVLELYNETCKRVAELETENKRLDKANAELDSLLASAIKCADKAKQKP